MTASVSYASFRQRSPIAVPYVVAAVHASAAISVAAVAGIRDRFVGSCQRGFQLRRVNRRDARQFRKGVVVHVRRSA